MDEAGYKTLLEFIVNNGTIQLYGVTPTDAPGAAGLQAISIAGNGTGTIEVYSANSLPTLTLAQTNSWSPVRAGPMAFRP